MQHNLNPYIGPYAEVVLNGLSQSDLKRSSSREMPEPSAPKLSDVLLNDAISDLVSEDAVKMMNDEHRSPLERILAVEPIVGTKAIRERFRKHLIVHIFRQKMIDEGGFINKPFQEMHFRDSVDKAEVMLAAGELRTDEVDFILNDYFPPDRNVLPEVHGATEGYPTLQLLETDLTVLRVEEQKSNAFFRFFSGFRRDYIALNGAGEEVKITRQQRNSTITITGKSGSQLNDEEKKLADNIDKIDVHFGITTERERSNASPSP